MKRSATCPPALSAASFPRFLLAALLGACSCALVVGFGLEALKLLPFSLIALAVFFNNAVIAGLLGPVRLKLPSPRVGRWDLFWREIMDPEDCRPGPSPRLGLALVWLGAAGGWVTGLALSLGLFSPSGVSSLTIVLLPFMAVLLIGCYLL